MPLPEPLIWHEKIPSFFNEDNDEDAWIRDAIDILNRNCRLKARLRKKKKAAKLAKIHNSRIKIDAYWWIKEVRVDGVIPTAQSSVERKLSDWWQDRCRGKNFYKRGMKKKTLRTFRTGSCHCQWRRASSRFKREENRNKKVGYFPIEIIEWYYDK